MMAPVSTRCSRSIIDGAGASYTFQNILKLDGLHPGDFTLDNFIVNGFHYSPSGGGQTITGTSGNDTCSAQAIRTPS